MGRRSFAQAGNVTKGAISKAGYAILSKVDSWVAKRYLNLMSQPVKLSDELVLDARVAGAAVERSIAGQVEFWAKLGRAIEPLLQGTQVLALCRNAKPISECLSDIDSPAGRAQVQAYLQTVPYPHFEAAPGEPGLLIRIDADGTRTKGRFVNRQFEAAKSKPSRK